MFEIGGGVELGDDLAHVAEIFHAGDDEDAVGALVGEEFGLAGEEAVFVAGAGGSSGGGLGGRAGLAVRLLGLGGGGGGVGFSGLLGAEHFVEDFHDALGAGALELDEFGDDLRGLDIDEFEEAEGLADDRGFVGENDRVGVWNGNEGPVGVDLDDALDDGHGLLGRDVVEGLVEADDLVAIGREFVEGVVEREALGARGAARAEDLDRLVVDRNDAVVVHQKGAFDDADGILAGDGLGDEDGEFVAGEVRVADDAFAGEVFVEIEDVGDLVFREGEAHLVHRAGSCGLRRRDGGGDGVARGHDLRSDLRSGRGRLGGRCRILRLRGGGEGEEKDGCEKGGVVFHGPGTGWAGWLEMTLRRITRRGGWELSVAPGWMAALFWGGCGGTAPGGAPAGFGG